MRKMVGVASILLCLAFSGMPGSPHAGEYDDEIAARQATLAKNPADVDTRYALGNYLAWDGRYDEALQAYTEILRTTPDYLDADIGIARVHAWQGNQQQAIARYQEILHKDPQNFEAYQGLGNLTLWINEFEKSIDYFRQALALKPRDIVSLKGIGRAYLGRGDRRTAEEYFTRAEIAELKQMPLPQLVGIVAGSAFVGALLFWIVRSGLLRRRRIVLRMELANLRYALALYQNRTGRLPLAIEELARYPWTPPGHDTEVPLYEDGRHDDNGFFIDPYGRRYWYDAETGAVYSTTRGCEKW